MNIKVGDKLLVRLVDTDVTKVEVVKLVTRLSVYTEERNVYSRIRTHCQLRNPRWRIERII